MRLLTGSKRHTPAQAIDPYGDDFKASATKPCTQSMMPTTGSAKSLTAMQS
jgi:hypothetical protein